MVHKEDTSPATKKDLAIVKADLETSIEDLRREIHAEAKETRRHFDVVAEKLLHDFKGAFKDRTSQHEDKIEALEGRMDRVERRLEMVV